MLRWAERRGTLVVVGSVNQMRCEVCVFWVGGGGLG